nr:ABC transporter ATP-binding protein [Acidobacteriota bacterium]
GHNGSGKSTLLKLIAGIHRPTSGTITANGRVSAMLELGAGFHPELSGRDNIYLNGSILGMTKPEIDKKFDDIVAFSGVEQFIDQPVKNYSSGMYVRLGFSVAIHVDPEILLVDEVLAVGDAAFQKKCIGKMGEVAKVGRTVLFVSHNMGAIATLCNRCFLIEKGTLVRDGRAAEVISCYQSNLYSFKENSADLTDVERYGTGKARFTKVKLTPIGAGGSHSSVLQTGGELKVELDIIGVEEVKDANVALIIYDQSGYRLIDANLALKSTSLSVMPGQQAHVQFNLYDLLLKPGIYLLGLWIGRNKVNEDIDGIASAISLTVEADTEAFESAESYPGTYQCRFSYKISEVSS